MLVSWQSEGEEILLTVQGSHFEVIMSGECREKSEAEESKYFKYCEVVSVTRVWR